MSGGHVSTKLPNPKDRSWGEKSHHLLPLRVKQVRLRWGRQGGRAVWPPFFLSLTRSTRRGPAAALIPAADSSGLRQHHAPHDPTH